MGYSSLRRCVEDLARHGHLIRISEEVDPRLEMAEIQRRVYRAGGPAILFERVAGSPFPAVSNLFGTMERARFIFRDTLERVKKIVALKADPDRALRNPLGQLGALATAARSLPTRLGRNRLTERTSLDRLPQIQSWPDDGGPFITLPQVITEDPDAPGILKTNVGMYRVQLAGNRFAADEVGLHFQIHRGIGVHFARASDRRKPLPVTVAVGGPPAHTLAAVMPLPEGLSELLFAGMLGNRRFRYERTAASILSCDADFCLVGEIPTDETRPEGPFGDHLGYYSLSHEFPFMRVREVRCRPDAIWPFTVVGRPPQEDTTFGRLIHEITAPMVPREIPGLRAMHAVDAAGVHPLLIAIGSERYVPYEARRPQELLTIANAILGFGQASLAKYLFIVAGEDEPDLDTHDLPRFLEHLLRRIDPTRDLHFQTRTTIDTLDYSGTGLNEGSKVVVAAAGPPIRELATAIAPGLRFPDPVTHATVVLPGVLALELPGHGAADAETSRMAELSRSLEGLDLSGFPLVVAVDDAPFTAESVENFLWVTFTRSNPSHDIYGVRSFVEHKHWGCRGSLIIDARRKPHHAPPLIEDAQVSRRVDDLAAPGRPLHGII